MNLVALECAMEYRFDILCLWNVEYATLEIHRTMLWIVERLAVMLTLEVRILSVLLEEVLECCVKLQHSVL